MAKYDPLAPAVAYDAAELTKTLKSNQGVTFEDGLTVTTEDELKVALAARQPKSYAKPEHDSKTK